MGRIPGSGESQVEAGPGEAAKFSADVGAVAPERKVMEARAVIAAHLEADFMVGDGAPRRSQGSRCPRLLGNLGPCGSGRLTPAPRKTGDFTQYEPLHHLGPFAKAQAVHIEGRRLELLEVEIKSIPTNNRVRKV